MWPHCGGCTEASSRMTGTRLAQDAGQRGQQPQEEGKEPLSQDKHGGAQRSRACQPVWPPPPEGTPPWGPSSAPPPPPPGTHLPGAQIQLWLFLSGSLRWLFHLKSHVFLCVCVQYVTQTSTPSSLMPTTIGLPGVGERIDTGATLAWGFWGSCPRLPVGLEASTEVGAGGPQAEQLSPCGQTLQISIAGQSTE